MFWWKSNKKKIHASSGSSFSSYNQVLPHNAKAYICTGVYDSFGAKKNYFVSGLRVKADLPQKFLIPAKGGPHNIMAHYDEFN